MTDPVAARCFLNAEVDALEPLDFVAVIPHGNLLHIVEVARGEREGFEVRVPARPGALPALAVEIEQALRSKGFEPEDPSPPAQGWVRKLADAGSAVELLQETLVDVWGEKPDAALDVAHGSHKLEREAKRKLELARSRIERIVTDVLGHEPAKDEDGDYVLPIAEVHIVVAPRASVDGQIIVRVFAITNVDVNVNPELGLVLARLNFGLMFGRFALDAAHRSIWFDETLLGEHFREEELRFAIKMVSSTADGWDDRLKQMFGGSTYQEILAGRVAAETPPTKPGEGVGLYL